MIRDNRQSHEVQRWGQDQMNRLLLWAGTALLIGYGLLIAQSILLTAIAVLILHLLVAVRNLTEVISRRTVAVPIEEFDEQLGDVE